MTDHQLVLSDLTGLLGARLFVNGDAEFDRRRSLFNAMIDRCPLAIAACELTSDVAAVVRIAGKHGIGLSIKGGGHGISGNAVAEGAIMIDLEGMTQLDIDPDRQIVQAGPGLRLGAFVTGCEALGFVSPTGTVSDTGIAGLTLGAGFGYLNGTYGLAIDNLVGAELVTAAGDVLEVNDTSHPDLMWALRGGGGNFGVVTRFDLRVYPGTEVLGGMVLYPWPVARDLLRLYRDTCATAPDELIMYAACLTAPDGNKAVGVIACWRGDLAQGQEVLAPIRAFGPPIVDLIEPCAYSRMNTLVDEAVPPRLRYY
ncbi:MAG TPA: FAD-binding oxidoreductase, partial [Thermomicrobiales bacterium]|nr:FAD-binding oxidoreductase [Thermomicrobiales bacterium]